MIKFESHGSRPSRRALAAPLLGTIAAILATGCTTAFVAIGVSAVGVGAAALAFQCDEPVSVSVWDPGTAHAICDAVVTATAGSDKVEFSPCYTSALGEGTWTVTATRAGYAAATGTITVEHDHRCDEPSYHSLELTLSGGSAPMGPPPAWTAPGPSAPPAPAAPAPAARTGATPQPTTPAPAQPAGPPPQASSAAPAPAPSPTQAPSGAATAPKAAFPPAAPTGR